jgi:hypothetical protein
MDYSFPDEFPEKSRRAILAEDIKARADFKRAKKEVPDSRLRNLFFGLILRVFIVFPREAKELVHHGTWSIGELQEESLRFLHHCAVSALYDWGYDRHGHRICEMVSNFGGGLLPEVERAFQKDPLWQEYEDILLEVAKAPAEPPATRTVEGVWEDIEISFLSDERVEVKIGTQVRTLNYAEMGFRDRRSGNPNQAWGLLRALAHAGGGIPDSARNSKDFMAMGKRIERMRKTLKTHFQIASDPIPKDPPSGYCCRFKIGCAGSFQT